VIAMMMEEPDDELTPEQIAAELRGAGIGLTKLDLQVMIKAVQAEAKVEPRAVGVFALKPMLPSHVSYETGRRACASGALRATKIAGDWYVEKEDVRKWLASSGHWFTDESAATKWLAYIAGLKPKWIG
jgi:hypothetical protein